MKELKSTKIIATLGPSTNTKEKIYQLAIAGVNVFRLNFSHCNYQFFDEMIKAIHEVNDENDMKLGILADLQGPKIRVGEVEKSEFELKEGDIVNLKSDKKVSNKNNIYVSYEGLEKDVKKDERVYINDGIIVLKIIEDIKDGAVKAEVLNGGKITARKGVNFPDTSMQLPSLTEKDLQDLEYIVNKPFNWVALSFVRTAQNIKDLKKKLKEAKHKAHIIAKIEKPEAVQNIKKIMKYCDAIMVARGDLGVEIPMEQLPGVQKELIDISIRKSKVVIVATQMMESMITNTSPTRAEVTDVANAVIQGADAVMLSGETAMGNHPIKVVQIMRKILVGAEKSFKPSKTRIKPEAKSRTFESDIVCFNAAKIANEVGAKAIIGLTVSGYTAFKVSSFRPETRIYIFSKLRSILSTLNLVRGVKGFYYNKKTSTVETHRNLISILKEKDLLQKGDMVVFTGSMPVFGGQRTNLIRVVEVD